MVRHNQTAGLVARAIDSGATLKPLNEDVGGQALAVLERLVQWYCAVDPSPVTLNSRRSPEWADALRVLATAGRVILCRDDGPYVTANWVRR